MPSHSASVSLRLGLEIAGQVIDLFTKKSKTCPSDLPVDKHLIFGQNGENYSELVQKTKKNLEYSDFILIFAP